MNPHRSARALILLALICAVDTAADGAPRRRNRRDKAGEKKVQDKSEKRQNSPSKRGDTPPPRRLTSEENRRRLRAAVMGEIGLFDLIHFGVGIRGMMYITPKLAIDATYSRASFALFGYESTYDLASTHAKWFFGNSFYLTGGAGISRFAASSTRTTFTTVGGNEDSDSDSFVAVEETESYDNTSLVAELGIGNHWQFSSFTLGCDWAGAVVPIATLSETSDPEESESTETASEDADDLDASDDSSDMKASATSTKLNFVRFYLGWAF